MSTFINIVSIKESNMILNIDHNLKEHVRYKDPSFLMEVWTGNYSRFPDGIMSSHWHNIFEYGIVISGEIECYLNELHFTLKEGDCVFLNSGILHYMRQKDNFENSTMFTVGFPHTLLCGNLDNTVYKKYFEPILESLVQGFKINKEVESGKRIIEILWRIYNLKDDGFAYELDCIQYISELWKNTCIYFNEVDLSSFQFRSKSSLRNELRSKLIISYIHKYFGENIKIDDIASYANVSRSECFRSFKLFTDKTPVEYINDYRLSQASKLLLETEDSIADIGSSCGFNSSSYFGKLFREKYEVSPLKFRTSHNNINNDKNV